MTMTTQAGDLFAPPPSATHVTAPDGELFIWLAGPGLVAEIGVGVFSLELAQAVIAFFQPIVDPGTRFLTFIDFERLTHYTRDARDLLTAYSLQHLDSLGRAHMLLSSKMVALGVSSYKHEVGDPLVHTYADRASFLRSYAQALGR